MADPAVPNFVSGIGRLATDRFTYEKHINGTDDRHQAGQIDLFPTVVIGTTKTNVQDAITAISSIIGTPPPDASTTVKGIVKLAGDIAGTALSVTVTKIQGKPVSTSTPTSGDVLTWDGSVWKPQSIVGTFANLTVTGNTTLGTTSANTVLVNSQVTLSNNLTVNGNTNLGNASSDITTITGIFNVSGGNISLTGASTATFSAQNITIHSGGTGGVSFGADGSLTATAILNITGSSINVITPTLNLLGSSIVMQTVGTNHVNSIVINPDSYTSLNGQVQQNTGILSIFTGASFYIYPGSLMTTYSNIIMAGTSKINRRRGVGPNSNSDIYPGLYDTYDTSIVTADQQWTINETTYPATQVGIEFEVINYGSHTITIYSPTPFFTNIVSIPSMYRAVLTRKSGSNGWSLLYKNFLYT